MSAVIEIKRHYLLGMCLLSNWFVVPRNAQAAFNSALAAR